MLNSKGVFTDEETMISQMIQMYDSGLHSVATNLGVVLSPPRRKIRVLVIGNHSSGKSSFINWYVGANVLPTGVAIETKRFTICKL